MAKVRFKLSCDKKSKTLEFTTLRVYYRQYEEPGIPFSAGGCEFDGGTERRATPESYNFTLPNGDEYGVAIDYLEWIEFPVFAGTPAQQRFNP